MRKFVIILGVIGLSAVMALKGQWGEIRYVAVGDSYTIGTSVNPEDSWPEQLIKDLSDHKIKIKLMANLAEKSKATREIISEQLPKFDRLSPTFATIQVGANDLNRGYPKDEFQKNLVIILDRMMARLPRNKLIVLTIPDFSVTPVGKSFGDQKKNSMGIKELNGIIREEAGKRNLPVVDVYGLSQEMGKDFSLMAHDDLHPSAKEYALWEKVIFPVALDLLKK